MDETVTMKRLSPADIRPVVRIANWHDVTNFTRWERSIPDLQFAVYDRDGNLVGNYAPVAPRFWVRDFVVVNDVDHDGRDEVLFGFRDNSGGTQGQWLSLLESTAPVGVASNASDLKLVTLGSR